MEKAPGTPHPRLNVVLVHPEIPPNTGNVARMCGATQTRLHLVHPLGFKVDDRHLRRAGLDYWDQVEVIHHRSLEAFLDYSSGQRLLLFSARGERPYTEAPYSQGAFLLFGSETQGLPSQLLDNMRDSVYYIPIWGKVRSLNLATAVGIVTYEAYRSLGFGPHWRIKTT